MITKLRTDMSWSLMCLMLANLSLERDRGRGGARGWDRGREKVRERDGNFVSFVSEFSYPFLQSSSPPNYCDLTFLQRFESLVLIWR